MPGDAAAVDDREGELLSIQVGEQIRQLRGRHDLTLAELAARCRLSQPFLSQVERGKATPSLLTLHRIAQAFGTDVPTLLGGIGNDPVGLVRAGEGQVFERGEEPGEARERLLVGSRRLMEPGEVVVRPGGSSGHAIEHAGEEFIYVISGRLRVELDERSPVELARGDCYYYPATVPHRWAAVGRTEARFLVVATPSSF